MKILVTAFEPFGGEAINPSMNLLNQLPESIKHAQIIKCLLPVTFHDSKVILESNILSHKPDVILSLGQAGGRACITVEQVAINLNEAVIADNAGYQPKGQAIDSGSPDGLFATLPIKAMIQASKEVGIPASISYTAGTYVCNHVMYVALNAVRQHHLETKAGFVHIPYETAQVLDKPSQPAMSAESMLKSIIAMLEEIIDPSVKLTNSESGTTH